MALIEIDDFKLHERIVGDLPVIGMVANVMDYQDMDSPEIEPDTPELTAELEATAAMMAGRIIIPKALADTNH